MSDSDSSGGGWGDDNTRPLRIYVLRHEKRPVDDPTFDVSLTDEGLEDAEELVCEELNELGVNAVYSSPYKRVLQTVEPYLDQVHVGMGACVEWCLSEHPEPNDTPPTEIPDEWHDEFSIESTHVPLMTAEEAHAKNRTIEQVFNRLADFVELLSKVHDEGDVVLLATHQTSVHALLSMASGIPVDCMDVPMGKMVELDWHGVIKYKYHGEARTAVGVLRRSTRPKTNTAANSSSRTSPPRRTPRRTDRDRLQAHGPWLQHFHSLWLDLPNSSLKRDCRTVRVNHAKVPARWILRRCLAFADRDARPYPNLASFYIRRRASARPSRKRAPHGDTHRDIIHGVRHAHPRALRVARRLSAARPHLKSSARAAVAAPRRRRPNHAGKCLAYFDDSSDFGGGGSGVDPESLAILQQRLGQRIDLEGEGAERLNKTAGLLLDASGRAIDKDERRKVLKADRGRPGAAGARDLLRPGGLVPRRRRDQREHAHRQEDEAAKEIELQKKEEEELRKEYEAARAELEAARDARIQPTTHDELVAYFFSTEFNEMEYEIVKQRPLLTDDFFAYLAARRDGEGDEEEKGKLDALFTVTSNFVGFVDQTTRAMLSPLERMKKLLGAKDKKAMILEMVDNDELDLNLMALLKTNINTARQAGQEDAAKFMEKIYAACAKFVDGA